MAALAAESAATPTVAVAPAFRASLDPEARFSKSRCHLLLRWKIGTSPSLDQERCLARDALPTARTSSSLVILEAP